MWNNQGRSEIPINQGMSCKFEDEFFPKTDSPCKVKYILGFLFVFSNKVNYD